MDSNVTKAIICVPKEAGQMGETFLPDNARRMMDYRNTPKAKWRIHPHTREWLLHNWPLFRYGGLLLLADRKN